MSSVGFFRATRRRVLWRAVACVAACLGWSAPAFADVVASCIRLVALSEVNGRAWTSAAEIDLVNPAGQRLAKASWTLVSVDSEETAAEDGRARNAFDGNTATLWHTQWSQASPQHPHRIDINLGSSQTLRALEYLPRQGGNLNGTIARYEVYASQNCSSWARVAEGTWANSAARKSATLNTTNAVPAVSVTAPANGAVFAPNAIVTFTGTANDAEDGNLSSGLAWSSSLSGALGSGATLSTALPLGTHTVTASVADSGGQTGSATVTITVGTPPAQPLAMCVRLVALSEVNGRAWTSAAEIDVLNTAGQRLPRTGWTILSTDSEELVGEDGRALNAIDGNTNTIWHTQWEQASPPPPHRIDIRLGTAQAVGGLEYLPRQDGSQNGTIAGYEVYTSQNCSTWTLASQGTWANTPNRKTAAFSVGGNASPTVAVTAPANGAVFTTTDVITFRGTASDAEDGNLAAGLTWRSSLSGLLGSGAQLSTSLGVGTHTVTASVADSAGAGGSASVTIVVGNPTAQIIASCVRLVALSEINGRPWTSVAEIDVLNASGQRISKTGWTLGSVDSQELVGEDGRASNAFDGSTATIWHTEWLQTSPPPPHRIDINLGSPQIVTALEYLPRQDDSVNGNIAAYEVYTSQNCSAWVRVAQGSWPAGSARKSTTLVDAGAPTANAGADRTVIAGASVTLNGSASSDSGGTITTYRWLQTAGPTVVLATPNAAQTSFTAPQVGAPTVLTFELLVTDNDGNSAADTVSITVNPDPATTPTLSFQEITSSAGVGSSAEFGGHGSMFGDVNGDGLADLYVTRNFPSTQLAEHFFLNLGAGQFREEAAARGIANVDSGSHGGVWADFDNDGDLDLFNGSFDQNHLYRNNGAGVFTEITFAAGLPARAWPTRAVVAFDMENDGDLDIFGVSGYLGNDDPAELNEVYRNNGNMTFTSVESGALANALAGQGATSVDFDNDGDVDVFAANRTGPIAILRNNGSGGFTQVDAASLGLQPEGRDGITFADVNNDGFLDVLLSQVLYVHNGGSGYVRRQAFETSTYHYMGNFADLDNDADVDLVFPGANRVYLNDGAGNFTPTPTFSIGTIDDPRSVSFADVEQDGDLDFMYAQKWESDRLIRNDLSSTNRWLKLNLRAANGQRNPYGARVFVYELGGLGDPAHRIAWWELRSQDGYLAQTDGAMHLGVGQRARVAVRVRFLGGATVDYPDVPTNSWVAVGTP